MKSLNYLAITISIISIILSAITFSGIKKVDHVFGGAVLSTASSDTLETFRTNVNTSLANLSVDNVATTTSNTWTALQVFSANASSTIFSSFSAIIGGTASTSITNSGRIGVSTTSPYAKLAVEMDTVNPAFVVSDQGTTTPFLVVTSSGSVGIGTSTPIGKFGVGSGTATSTISGGRFCAFFTDEGGRGMWIKLSVSGNTVFSTSTTACQ